MMEHINPESEWHELQYETLQEFEKSLEDRLLGKTIEIEYLDHKNGHGWKIKRMVVAGVEYQGNKAGYSDSNGPTFIDTEGNKYQTHPEYGVKILDS